MYNPSHVLPVLLATAVPSDLGFITVTGTHKNPNLAEFVSMLDGTNIYNCVFQLRY